MLKDVNIWYPNQDPANIIPYPFTIELTGDCVAQNVALVNSYQGIGPVNGNKAILSTIVGTPLYKGILLDTIYDVPHAEDIRFSPDLWPASGLTNAPPPNGSHAAWMRANGTGMQLIRVDGLIAVDTYISGYNIGIMCTNTGNGDPGATFNTGVISNCATAILAQNMPSGLGLMFASFTIDGDIAINRTRTTSDANMQFQHCTIIGRNGTAVNSAGADAASLMQFQNCTISNALQLAGPGIFNVVNSTLLGSTQCVLSATASRASFTGCTFSPATNIVNQGNPANVLFDSRPSSTGIMPSFSWTSVINNYLSRKPANTTLYIATSAAYGAVGDGNVDDTVSIQNALNAASANGGGIVYLPAGKYRLTATLDVPTGVELRGTFEARHGTSAASDGHAKGTILRPYAGQGATNGPPAIALEPNSGLVGVTISYETQNTNCIPFPPTIQGRGANIYVIGVNCPNPFYFLDLDTYTCTNHFVYMADGWALKTGFNIGNGSAGTIVNCHDNWTYWIDNGESSSTLPTSIQAPVITFVAHNMQMYNLGDCTELMVKDFSIIENTYMNFRAENGRGPNTTLISDYCDATIQGIVMDAAAPCAINALNTVLCVFNFNNDTDLTNATVDVLGTTNFQGVARFFNTSAFAQPYLDLNINGGNVGFELADMDSTRNGSIVNGGALHLVNLSAHTVGPNPPYNVSFGLAAGIPGDTSEFIAAFSQNGYSYTNPGATNLLNVWGNFGYSSYPPIPAGLTTSSNSLKVTVSWTASGGVTNYNIKRSTSSAGPFTPIATTFLPIYSDTNIIPGATYYYVVSALNQFGEGANSAPVGTRDILLSRSGWIATASGGDPPANAIDGNAASRWSTAAFQTPGEWFQVDMRSVRTVFKIVLDATASPNDYPRGYQVTLSNDGTTWSSPVATGAGFSAVTTITFPAQSARYIRVTQTGSASANYWSIHEFNAYGRPPAFPTGVTAAAGDGQVTLAWNPQLDATGFYVKRSPTSNGAYSVIAPNIASTGYTNTGLTNGTVYYYAVSATNSVGESDNSPSVIAQPTSATVPHLNFGFTGNQLQFAWPSDHTGWLLQAQTNSANNGLGTNWVTLPASSVSNQILLPINPTAGGVFFRLVHP